MFRFDAKAPSVPTTIQIPLADGELAFEPRSTTTGQGVQVWRRYESGHPLLVAACGVFPVDQDITFSADELASHDLTPNDLVSRQPIASVIFGNKDAQLVGLLQLGGRMTYSTPTMVEVIFTATVVDDIEAEFQVRLFDTGDMWQRVTVLRGDPDRGVEHDATGITEHLIVSIFGVTVFSGEFTLFKNGMAHWVRYDGDDQYPHRVFQDADQVQRTGQVPRMGWISDVPPEALALHKGYTPGELTYYKPSMGDAGVTFELGPVTGWAARWFATGHPDARAAVLNAADSLGAYPIIWRGRDGVLKPSERPGIAWNGRDGKGASRLQNGSNVLKASHCPEMWVAWVLTGDVHYLRIMSSAAMALYMQTKAYGGNGQGIKKRYQDEVRATAWSIRAVGECCKWLPDGDTLLEEMRELLWTQIEIALQRGPDNRQFQPTQENPDPEPCTLGIPWANYLTNPGKPIKQRPWMHNFWAWVIAYLSRSDALRGERKDEARRLARWMLQSVIWQLEGPTGNCPAWMAQYSLKYSDQTTRAFGAVENADKLFRNGRELFAFNGIDGECPGEILRNSSTAPGVQNSHVVQMMPAIAECFEHDIPRIAELWDNVRRTSNYARDIYSNEWWWGGWGVAAENQPLEPLVSAAPPAPVLPADPPDQAPVTEPDPLPYAGEIAVNTVVPVDITCAEYPALVDAVGGPGYWERNVRTGNGPGALSLAIGGWSGAVLIGRYMVIDEIGGHSNGSGSGVFAYDTIDHRWAVLKLPIRKDHPDLPWDKRYLSQSGHGRYPADYLNSCNPPYSNDIVPDGDATNGIGKAPSHVFEARCLDKQRNVVWNLDGSFTSRDVETQELIVHGRNGRVTYKGEEHLLSGENIWVFDDPYHDRLIGSILLESERQAGSLGVWRSLDKQTAELTDLPNGGLHNTFALSVVEVDREVEHVLVPRWCHARGRNRSRADRFNVWDVLAGEWRHKARDVTGTPWTYPQRLEFAALPGCTDVPPWDRILYRKQGGPRHGALDVFDWRTGDNSPADISGMIPLDIEHIGSKLKYQPMTGEIVAVCASDEGSPAAWRIRPAGSVALPPPSDDPKPVPVPVPDPEPLTLESLADRVAALEAAVDAMAG